MWKEAENWVLSGNGSGLLEREGCLEISNLYTCLNADENDLLGEEPGITESRVVGAEGSRKGEGQSHQLVGAGLASEY